MTISTAGFAELAAAAWKLAAGFDREIEWLPDDRRDGAAAALRYARRRLDALLAAEGCRLVTYDGEGHGSYGGKSACVDRIVVDYRVKGTVPRDGVRCD